MDSSDDLSWLAYFVNLVQDPPKQLGLIMDPSHSISISSDEHSNMKNKDVDRLY